MEARSGYPAPETSAEGEFPWNRSFHTHSAPYKCVTVSRTELKLEPRLRVNCSFVSAEQASSNRRSAQALYWNRKRSSSGVTIENPPAWILMHEFSGCVAICFAINACRRARGAHGTTLRPKEKFRVERRGNSRPQRAK